MTSTTEQFNAPAWATRTSEVANAGDPSGPKFHRRLETRADLRTVEDGHLTIGEGTAFPLGFELGQWQGEAPTILESDSLPLSWLIFSDPAAVRELAATLDAAADEWESLMGDAR